MKIKIIIIVMSIVVIVIFCAIIIVSIIGMYPGGMIILPEYTDH